MSRGKSQPPLLTQMYGPAVRRKGFHRSVGFAVLHQCIRPLIGACCAPGHHGYQRARVLITGPHPTEKKADEASRPSPTTQSKVLSPLRNPACPYAGLRCPLSSVRRHFHENGSESNPERRSIGCAFLWEAYANQQLTDSWVVGSRRGRPMERFGLRNDQWERIKDVLPGREGHVGGTAEDNRLFVEAVLYRFSPTLPIRGKKLIESTAAPRKSPLHLLGHRTCRRLRRRGDARRRLGRQIELELLHQQLLFGVEFGVAAQDQRAAIGGREVDVEHLDSGELVEHSPRGEAGRQRLELSAQRDVKAIGQEGDEDVRFDAVLKLVVDRAELQIVLEILERGLDLDELDIELHTGVPDLGRTDWCAADSAPRAGAFGEAC